ncbi:MAG: CAP domain-containing protein [Acidobacteriota bacterium]
MCLRIGCTAILIALVAVAGVWFLRDGVDDSEASRVEAVRGETRAGEVPAKAPSGKLPSQGSVSVPGIHLASVEQKVLELTNRERRRVGRRDLSSEDGLRDAARSHNHDMFTRRFWGHGNPDGEGPGDRVARLHRRLIGTVGENIWQSVGLSSRDSDALAQRIVESWMGSEGHRENILRDEFTHLGVGITQEGNELRATQVFADVWGYLDNPLAGVVQSGTGLDLRARATPGNSSPERFDVVNVKGGRKVAGPSSVSGARLDVSSGRYQLRFYFPYPGGYQIVGGPSVEVK